MVDINDYVVNILNDKKICADEFQRFIENNYSIENVQGHINGELLYKVICKARKNKKIRILLSDILTYIDASSMSDINFKNIFKFPRKYRDTYLSNIGHTSLSFYQMQILNRYPLSFEVFSWLFDNVCKHDIFTNEDMLQILKQNRHVRSTGIEQCIKLAFNKYGSSSKLDIAEEWRLNLRKFEKY